MKLSKLVRWGAIGSQAVGLATAATYAPAGCRKLATDADWPSHAVWKAALPGVTRVHRNDDTVEPLPNYRLRVQSVEDVEAAVTFATQHNIRLTVITTGHDQLGRNDAGSGLIIDLSEMNGVRVQESYTPTREGTPRLNHDEEPNVITPTPGVQAAVTFGPARAGLLLNYALDPSGLFATTGAAATVAVAGGWGQNGGYGPLTQQYGLGVDQWLEAKIVTPDGKLRIANQVSNPDLFWAIRGGGGGTFGVLVEATWKAYPVVPMTGFNWWINSTNNDTSIDPETGKTAVSDAMEYLMSQLPHLQELGVTAYLYVFPTNIRGYAVHPGDLAGTENANQVWGPILRKMQSFPNMTPFQTHPYNFKNYKEFFDTTYGPIKHPDQTPAPPHSRGIVPFDSRLLAPEHLQSPNITYALRTTGGSYGLLMCAPGDKVGDGSDTAANPGWRRAVVLANAFKTKTTSAAGMRELAPDMGTYINEASVDQADWSRAFWGDNYPRLSKIKAEHDPNMTFWVSPGINADWMEAEGDRACLVEPRPTKPSWRAPHTEKHVAADLEKDGDFLFGKTELIGAQFPAPGTWIGLQPAE